MVLIVNEELRAVLYKSLLRHFFCAPHVTRHYIRTRLESSIFTSSLTWRPPCVTLVVWMNESNSWHVLVSNIRYAGRDLSDGLSLWLRCRSCSDTSDSSSYRWWTQHDWEAAVFDGDDVSRRSWPVVVRPYSAAVSPTLPALIGRRAVRISAPCTKPARDSKTSFCRDDCLHHCDRLGLDDAKMCHPKLRTAFIVRRERTILVVLPA